jgi:hypothetical protein
MRERSRGIHGISDSDVLAAGGADSDPGLPGTSPGPGPRGGRSSRGRHDVPDLNAVIRELVDAAPPLSSEQRDTLSLLLRRPRRR